ncbi:hypothetical protein C8R47DRAFT_183953 [Mycena vitilis]|nr:hypothetical protein C8R47DRAFT_183953 [Mycena vitilis]
MLPSNQQHNMPSESESSGTPTYNRPPAVINAGEYNQARKITRIRSPTTVTFDASIPIEMQQMLLQMMGPGVTYEQTQVYNGGLYNHSDELEETESETSIKYVASSSGSSSSTKNSSSQYQGSGTGDRQGSAQGGGHRGQNHGYPNQGYPAQSTGLRYQIEGNPGPSQGNVYGTQTYGQSRGYDVPPPVAHSRTEDPNMYHAQGNYNNQQYNVNYNEYDAPERMSRSRTY